MKINKTLLVSILFLGALYFVLDRQLFYYGKNKFNLYRLLPINITPYHRHDFEGGFALMDEYGFTIAAKGNKYQCQGKEIVISEVSNYYIGTNKIIAQIIDTCNNRYYIEFINNTKNLLEHDIITNVWSNEKNIDSNEFKSIGIKGNIRYINGIELSRNLIMLILIILFITLIYNLNFRKKSLEK